MLRRIKKKIKYLIYDIYLQLNTYKRILERKYGKTVTDLYLVRLHPDAEEKNYELIKLPDLSKEIDELFEERKQKLIS